MFTSTDLSDEIRDVQATVEEEEDEIITKIIKDIAPKIRTLPNAETILDSFTDQLYDRHNSQLSALTRSFLTRPLCDSACTVSETWYEGKSLKVHVTCNYSFEGEPNENGTSNKHIHLIGQTLEYPPPDPKPDTTSTAEASASSAGTRAVMPSRPKT